MPRPRMATTATTAIITPAMIATWVLGLWLVWASEAWRAGWFQAKFILVLLLSGVHGLLVRWFKLFAADQNRRFILHKNGDSKMYWLARIGKAKV